MGELFLIHAIQIVQPDGSLYVSVQTENRILQITPSSAAVPEPSSFALMGLGGMGMAIGAYRRRKISVV